MVKELGEVTGRVHNKCEEILAITRDPVRMLTENDKFGKILDSIYLDIVVLVAYMNAHSNMDKKEDEED